MLLKMESCKGVYVPPGIQYGNQLHFVADNVDFHNDTPEEKNELHETSQVVFQKSANAVPNLIINLNLNDSLRPIENP